MDEEVKRCRAPWCEAVLVRREGETSQNFRNRLYCGKGCAARHGNYRRRNGLKLNRSSCRTER